MVTIRSDISLFILLFIEVGKVISTELKECGARVRSKELDVGDLTVGDLKVGDLTVGARVSHP